MNLQIVKTIEDLRRQVSEARRQGRRIGLVPTMGALHEGHLSLVRAAQATCEFTVVTIFVNPTQFGPSEDLQKYPRTLDADVAALASCGADLVFVPDEREVYCPGHQTWVEVESLTQPLEGEIRPGHFRGVTTIVLKLFNMVAADAAFFGQKDYQQALVIRRMAADLNVPTEIHVCPVVREADGLAMSSRNAYLSPAARRQATVLSKVLRLAEELVEKGERSSRLIAEKIRKVIGEAPDATIDYIAIVDAETLEPLDKIKEKTLVALAVKIESTRLIDNCLLEPRNT